MLVAGCGAPAAQPATPAVEQLAVEVLDTRPHDPASFTQGFEVEGDVLYEGTGLEGASFVSATDLASGDELARVELDADLFGEGITVVGDTLWQITWQDGVAVRRDAATLAETDRVSYDGEGWGLCDQPDRLVMSDGSPTLTFRDPETFAATGTVDVTRDGQPLEQINELECTDDGLVWANVWQTDEIVRIDPATGAVTAVVDAAGLLPTADAAGADVLNGIAALPGTDTFLVTGKLWPTTFEVRFVPA